MGRLCLAFMKMTVGVFRVVFVIWLCLVVFRTRTLVRMASVTAFDTLTMRISLLWRVIVGLCRLFITTTVWLSTRMFAMLVRVRTLTVARGFAMPILTVVIIVAGTVRRRKTEDKVGK